MDDKVDFGAPHYHSNVLKMRPRPWAPHCILAAREVMSRRLVVADGKPSTTRSVSPDHGATVPRPRRAAGCPNEYAPLARRRAAVPPCRYATSGCTGLIHDALRQADNTRLL